ncbi:hypothetical protein Rmet_6571 [Cupriavidus metallidurans CH34]|uniref:Uncharacterized protein n=1 Tax=Cupriavidus metallidurans (strain ATCC 43123 / DSM 2839 / NBRC 102507 / CH34) TaxID=266264 RepID=D3DY04_CUPMC|nr:hypothetical protein Rmet_6571 [Cupriavidus metallidurans CH34]
MSVYIKDLTADIFHARVISLLVRLVCAHISITC